MEVEEALDRAGKIRLRSDPDRRLERMLTMLSRLKELRAGNTAEMIGSANWRWVKLGRACGGTINVRSSRDRLPRMASRGDFFLEPGNFDKGVY